MHDKLFNIFSYFIVLLQRCNCEIFGSGLLKLLHFARVVDDAKCIVVTHVCLSVCLQLHAHSIARTQM